MTAPVTGVTARPWRVDDLPSPELSTFIPDGAILRLYGDRVPFRSRNDALFVEYAVNHIEQAERDRDEARLALGKIAVLPMDMPAADGDPEGFYRDQLMTAIGTAARALARQEAPDGK